MDFTFLAVTSVLVILLFISYLLKVIKLSTPLVLIYLIFCFTYVIDSDTKKNNTVVIVDPNNSKDEKVVFEIEDTPIIASKVSDNLIRNEPDVSKPIVSSNPKPIVIDTNNIIKKDDRAVIVDSTNAEDTKTEEVNKNKEKYIEPLKVNEIMICRGVYKRNPIKPGFEFANNVDSLFCYTKISNKGPKQEIKHLWYHENKLITSVTYNIKTSYNYRSWSKKTILPSQIGQWRVDIIDSKDRVLGSRKFQIQLLNNAF